MQWYRLHTAFNATDVMIDNTTGYQRFLPNPDMSILVAGDSTAVGIGTTTNSASIAGRLAKEYPQADITNIGVNGAKLQDLQTKLEFQKERFKSHPFDLIVLQIGANDITHFTSKADIKDQLDTVLGIASSMGSKVLLLTSGDVGRAPVFYWPLSSIYSIRTHTVRDIFIEEASKFPNVSYVDLYIDRENDPFEKDKSKYYSSDLFHVTDDGYGVWYSQLQKFLN